MFIEMVMISIRARKLDEMTVQPVTLNGIHLVGVAQGTDDAGRVYYRCSLRKANYASIQRATYQLHKIYHSVSHR